jgi:hypothetical protein
VLRQRSLLGEQRIDPLKRHLDKRSHLQSFQAGKYEEMQLKVYDSLYFT